MDFLRRAAFFFLFFIAVLRIWSQVPDFASDPASCIGMSLEELLRFFGAPRLVYSIRGNEEWQDDIVFEYAAGDFYIIKDAVWQIGLKSAYQVSSGDSQETAYAAFGDAISLGRDYAVFPLRGRAWPMALRCNFDRTGRVAAIFIYRSDI